MTVTKSAKTINVASLLASTDESAAQKSADETIAKTKRARAQRETDDVSTKTSTDETSAAQTSDSSATVSAAYAKIVAYYKRTLTLTKSDADETMTRTVRYVREAQKITQREAIAVAQNALKSVRTLTASALRLEASRLTQEHAASVSSARQTASTKTSADSEQERLRAIAAKNKTKSAASVRADALRIADERKSKRDAAKSAAKNKGPRKVLGDVTNGSVRVGQVPRDNSVSARILAAITAQYQTRESILAQAKIDTQNDPWRQSFARLRYALRCERRIVNKTEEYRLIADALNATDAQRSAALAKRSALVSSDDAKTSTKSTKTAASAQTSDATLTSAQKRAATIAAKREQAQRDAAKIARAQKREERSAAQIAASTRQTSATKSTQTAQRQTKRATMK